MIDKSEVQKWLNEYGQAWVQGNPDALAKLFHDNATYQETPFDEPMQGKHHIRAYWQDGAADAQKDVSFSSEVWAVSDNEAFAEWTARFQRVASGACVELDGIIKLVFLREKADLKCLELREWWHRRESNQA